MKEFLKSWMFPAIALLITLFGWFGTYTILKYDVEQNKETLKAHNLTLMNYQLEQIIEENKKLNHKLDLLLGLE